MAKVLIAEDDADIRFSLVRALRKDGHEVTEVPDGDTAIAEIGQSSFDLVITDLQMPGRGGLDVVRAAREQVPHATVLVITAYGTVQSAVEAVKAGADDFLQKPLSLEELRLVVARLIETASLRKRVAVTERTTGSNLRPNEPIGSSRVWREALNLAERFARAPIGNRHDDQGMAVGGALTTILITGETGTGKGALARYIHGQNAQTGDEQPFIHVNCSAIPAQLFESELFGHERGAFTDAKSAREGLVEMADAGTLFLDEIGDLSLEMQSKLLLFLEQGRYRRVGGSRDRSVRCRVIAATNKDLVAQSTDGTFRSDLYYRVSTFGLELPALRDRDGDVLEIADSMIERFCKEYRRPLLRLSSGARDALTCYRWPGNVRELINIIQRACMLTDGQTLEASSMFLETATPVATSGPAEPGDRALRFDFSCGRHTLQQVERELIVQALAFTSGNVSRAARLIGMQRSSFRHRLEKYGINSEVVQS